MIVTGPWPRIAIPLPPLVIVTLGLASLSLAGCFPPPPAPADSTGEDEVPEPVLPAYLEVSKALGIWQALQRASMTLPAYLGEVPGVDGEGPFEVETIPDVPFRETPVRTLTVSVHRPKTDDQKLRRAVVLYAGGGFLADEDFVVVDIWAEYLASRGFVTFNTHQRLLTEPNVDLNDALSDIFAAVRFVASDGPRFGADPDRIGVLGRSSGGLQALLAGIYPEPDRFREPGDPDVSFEVHAIVDIAGPVDYARFADGEDFTLVPREEFLAAMGGTPAKVPETYALVSPLTYVRPGLPPIMIVHGALDTTVPISQSIELADRLEAAGNTVVREFYPDTGHVIGWGLFNNDGFGRAMIQIVRFLEERL